MRTRFILWRLGENIIYVGLRSPRPGPGSAAARTGELWKSTSEATLGASQ